MAAYAALVSVMQTIDQIEDHPHPPISLHQEQVTSLTQIITFLQDFLESYNPHLTYTAEADPLESRIAEAAYAAEDVIESYIVDQILARSTDHAKMISFDEFYQGLEKVIEEMDLIKMEVVVIKEKKGTQIKKYVADAGSSRSTSTAQKVGMVGFEDVLYQMLEQITRGGVDLQIIPIVGMGGIGKTTLARNIYINPLVEEHFDVCAWSTISQQYNALEIIEQVLDQVDKGNKRDLSEDDLGVQLYKYLIGRRFLIVMDDMWSIEAWDRVRSCFPDNGNGSRVVITTRLSNLASQFNNSNSLEMEFLDEANSWNLFSKTVFGEEVCPLELEDIGRKIVKGCKGLPLSIAVIGGLLSKTGRTRENWELIGENLSSIVNLEDNESCLQILFMSYNNLPVYLKPCFLYMGVFPEDYEIPILLSLTLPWVAEGFLKPILGKSLEEVAQEYVEELVDRNLLLAGKRNHYGKLTYCKMHDLLRDLSLREAQKVKFLCVLGEQSIHDIPQGMNSQRRILSTLSECPPTPLLQSLASASLVRSLLGNFPETLAYNFRFLRLSTHENAYVEEESSDDILHRLVNLRFLLFQFDGFFPKIPSSISSLWNLQIIAFPDLDDDHDYIFEIWKMPQLRHVIAEYGTLCLPDPNMMESDEVVVLKNLQTILVVTNLNFSEGVVKRIPNIKKLKLKYDETSRGSRGDYSLNNLSCLHRLESLSLCYSDKYTLTHLVSFPYSLKELSLKKTKLHWEEMQKKIGSLPLLQVLNLKWDSFIGSEWETFEGQFSSLKYLEINSCDLEYWKTDSYTHFPRLERLVLRYLEKLEEIPLSIGDIPTLRSLELYYCSNSARDYARRIQEEQEELDNEGLQIYVF